MKYLVASTALLLGMSGAAYSQSNVSPSNARPVHPGTALLDSMGIVAGAPEPAEKADARAGSTGTTVAASPNGTKETQQ